MGAYSAVVPSKEEVDAVMAEFGMVITKETSDSRMAPADSELFKRLCKAVREATSVERREAIVHATLRYNTHWGAMLSGVAGQMVRAKAHPVAFAA